MKKSFQSLKLSAFNHDNWICQLCGVKVLTGQESGHRLSPDVYSDGDFLRTGHRQCIERMKAAKARSLHR